MTFCRTCRATPCVCNVQSAAWLRENVASAKGVKKPAGAMNKTEQRYADRLAMQVMLGEVVWWKFGKVTFKIGDDCRFTPDFAVMLPDCTVEFIDTKGTKKGANGKMKAWSEEDARVKIAAAAEQFPFVFKRAFFANGEWVHEQVG